MLIRIFNFFLFSSAYIALCAIVMVHQTNDLLELNYNVDDYLFFVFSATLASYNFHWYLTPHAQKENIRSKWTRQHKTLQLVLITIGVTAALWFFFRFFDHWIWMSIAGLLTFLYSAPKLPGESFATLRKIAVGKTIFLAFVWTYVTTVLPVILAGNKWTMSAILFTISRFFLVYAICIVFDYRDRDQDKREGIRSMITYFNERGINALFYCSLILFGISTAALFYYSLPLLAIFLLIVPGIILLILYPLSKKSFSDYLYYFVLDGLMMLSALLTSIIPF